MSGLIINIVGVLIGVIIGGLITLEVNLYLQRREKKILYAQKNREKIYEPLYNEVTEKFNRLKEFSNPFSAYGSLNTWKEFKQSEKNKIPLDLKRIIEQLQTAAKEFYSADIKASKSLKLYIEKEIGKIIKENNITVGDKSVYKQTTKLALINCEKDFLAGKILNKIHSYSISSNLMDQFQFIFTFEDFFKRLCPKITTKKDILSFREKMNNMIKITRKLEEYLKNKIDYILKKYEGRLTKI